MKRDIFYLGYYTCEAIKSDDRYDFPAADTKMNYVCSALLRSGVETVNLISASGTRSRHSCAGKRMKIGEHIFLQTFFSFGVGNRVKKLLRSFTLRLQLLFALLLRIGRKDTLIVYHSLGYIREVSIAKKIKKFRLIEEVEEVYSDVSGDKKTLAREQKFFGMADAYLFSAQLLAEKINARNKPYVVANGTYAAEPDLQCRAGDGKTHVVYAGTLDPRKGGAVAAAAAARHLDERFHIHILGFGSDGDVENMRKLVASLAKESACGVSYEGCLAGEAYTRFLQSCDIGLSTQNPDADFNATSFPSKILVYLANGLKVVSIRIPAIEGSSVGPFLSYYEEQEPAQIAECIKETASRDAADGRQILKQLDDTFVEALKRMLEMDPSFRNR